MKVTLENKEYTFLVGYQKDDKYRNAFDHITSKIFELSFEVWYQSGYWNEKYIPYTLFDGEQAVSNISVNIMDFNCFGKKQRYIQLGTVLTDEAYRNRNLNKFIMEQILEEWNKKCDFIYLFANNTVLNMYPKYGFKRVKEYVYYKRLEKNPGTQGFEKLNMDIQKNREMLHKYIKNTKGFSNFFMHENADLVMFYCITILKESVYYIKPLDLIVIAMFNNNQLHICDIFGKTQIDLDTIIRRLTQGTIEEVLLGFTPKNTSSFKVKEIINDDALFIQNGKTDLFAKHKMMFPLLSHA